jgi:CheY-like chemotaxis protein
MRSTIASSGDEALEILGSHQTQPFALILLDYHMPGMDGIAVARAIKARAEFGAPTLLMLTSGGGVGDAQQARQAGIAMCLFKPFKQSELLAATLKALNGTAPTNGGNKTKTCVDDDVVGPPLRILLAEDNRVNQLLTVRMLEQRGHSVTAVQNGRDAVAAVENETFDLALLDVQMPEMDGLQAASLIRQKESTRGRSHLPLIALTAHAMSGDWERCLAAGMDGYVPKPVNSRQLFAIIKEVKVPLQARLIAAGANMKTAHAANTPPVDSTSDGPAGLTAEEFFIDGSSA